MNFDDYFIDGTKTLKNKLGITDIDLLIKEEQVIVLKKLTNFILEEYEFSPSASYLAFIHKYLFDDVYYFAGEYRLVNMFKQDSAFLDFNLIKEELPKVINKYNSMEVVNNKFTIARTLGEFYRELIYIHPFREGNGRSTRIWLDLILKKELKLVIDWSKINKEDYLLAMERSPIKDVEIKELLKKALTNKINDREVYMKGIDASYH